MRGERCVIQFRRAAGEKQQCLPSGGVIYHGKYVRGGPRLKAWWFGGGVTPDVWLCAWRGASIKATSITQPDNRRDRSEAVCGGGGVKKEKRKTGDGKPAAGGFTACRTSSSTKQNAVSGDSTFPLMVQKTYGAVERWPRLIDKGACSKQRKNKQTGWEGMGWGRDVLKQFCLSKTLL